MIAKNRLQKKLRKHRIKVRYTLRNWREKSKRITLPGLQGQSIYHVGTIFFKGFTEDYLTNRAAAVSFNFLTALFPLLLFFFTLIPYVPYPNFQADVLQLLQESIPAEIWAFLSPTISFIVTKKQGSLLSVGVIMALYFGSNGINSLMNAFTQSKENMKKFGWIRMRINAILILFIIVLLITISVSMAKGGAIIINYLNAKELYTSKFWIICIHIVRWLMSVLFLLTAVSFLYRLAVKEKKPFPFLSVGGIITTILMVLTTLGFSIYIENFTNYNALYGSLGTILILTMYLYLNSMFLLIGFEINASIYTAKMLTSPQK